MDKSDFDGDRMTVVKLGRGSRKVSLNGFCETITASRKPKPWIERSYDILNELVSSQEVADSHPLQHSALEYREALETSYDNFATRVCYGLSTDYILYEVTKKYEKFLMNRVRKYYFKG